jgi:plastocyanin
MASWRRLAPVGALALVAAPLAFAGTHDVGMHNSDFFPRRTTAAQGDTVRWTNDERKRHTKHSATSVGGGKGVGLWDSGLLERRQSFEFAFAYAGGYRYFCRLHKDMDGSIRVPTLAEPPSGGTGTEFTVIAGTEDAGADLVFDIEKREPGGDFEPWMTGVTTSRVTFTPTAPGEYAFRTRLRRLSTGGASGYSPAATISVT